MREIWEKLFGDARADSLWGQLRPWVMAALVTSAVPVLWAALFGVAPPSLESGEQRDYLLAEALTLRRLVSIVFLAVGVGLSIHPVRAVFSTTGWRNGIAYVCAALAAGILGFVFPLLSTFWSLVWISGELPTRRPFLWAFFGYHDPRIMILEYALPIPINSMVLAGMSLLIRWSRVGIYIVAGSILIFMALLVFHGVLLTD